MPRRVLGITAIRSEYYLQRSIFRAISQSPDLEFQLIVTGAHLSPMHGETLRVVESDGFHIAARIESLLYSNADSGRLKGAALQLGVLAHLVDAIRPDWLLAPADREEAWTMALCGAYMNVPVVHYSAGDRAVGNVDDTVRHSVSRLAHLLLTTNEDARQRLIRAGEDEWRVHNVGHAGLDRFRETSALSPAELAKLLQVARIEPEYAVVVQHPLSSEHDRAGEQMRVTLDAVKELGLQSFISYPNSDAGSHDMVRVIQEYRATPGFHVFENIPDLAFVNLLRGASVLVGNSSLGLLEAPFLKLPVVNVGNRQSQRVHAENVFFVREHDRNAIVDMVRRVLVEPSVREQVQRCESPFGDGHAADRVVRVLAETPIDDRLLSKGLAY